jgi:hypothetical protein
MLGFCWCSPPFVLRVLAVAALRSALVHHVQRVELEVVAVVEPGAGEVKEAQASADGIASGMTGAVA